MAHAQETRNRVRQIYIEGMPLSGAAITCGVSYETARAWMAKAKLKGDDWDTARAAFRISDQGVDDLNKQLVEDFARQVITTTRELETSKIQASEKAQLLAQLADAYSKFSRAFGRINPAYSGLSVALDTLRVIVDVLSQRDKAALKSLQPYIDEIGAILSKRYG